MACTMGNFFFFVYLFRGGGGGEVLPRRCRIMIPRPHVSNVEQHKKKLSGGRRVVTWSVFVLAFPSFRRLPCPCSDRSFWTPLIDLFIHLIVVARRTTLCESIIPAPPRSVLACACLMGPLGLATSMRPAALLFGHDGIRCRAEEAPRHRVQLPPIFN